MSGLEGIHVDHGTLARGAHDLLAAARGIEGRLDQLEHDLLPLRSEWTGQAKIAYDAAKASWDRAIADMIALLQEAGVGVEAANADYLAADRRGAGRF